MCCSAGGRRAFWTFDSNPFGPQHGQLLALVRCSPELTGEHQPNRIASFVERAQLTVHTEITVGGKARAGSGFFYEPTAVAGAREEDEIVKREVFGRVVSVTGFTDTEQAIAWTNDSDYGLASSVWTQDVARAMPCDQ